MCMCVQYFLSIFNDNINNIIVAKCVCRFRDGLIAHNNNNNYLLLFRIVLEFVRFVTFTHTSSIDLNGIFPSKIFSSPLYD